MQPIMADVGSCVLEPTSEATESFEEMRCSSALL
jgi:hypothetical protein